MVTHLPTLTTKRVPRYEPRQMLVEDDFIDQLEDKKEDRALLGGPAPGPGRPGSRARGLSTKTTSKSKYAGLSWKKRGSSSAVPEEESQTVELDKREIMKLKLYKDQIKRPDLPMDRSRKFKEEDLDIDIESSARQANFNQKLYLENFGVDVQIPSFFVIDAHLW